MNFSATIDMQQDLRDVYDEANRQNVALYPVDPRGLAVFEFDLSEPSVGSETDRQYLNATMDSLRTLAENTDGRAIVNRNDLEAGMRQIMRDSSAYYLLGYSSTHRAVRRQVPRDQGPREAARAAGPRAQGLLGAQRRADVAGRSRRPSRPRAPAVTAALANVASSTTRARIIRTWVGTSRGENGKTRVTFVWEPTPRTAADRPLAPGEQPSRVSVMAVGSSGSPFFRGRVPDMAVASSSPSLSGADGVAGRASRVVFDAAPGKMELRLSVEGGSGVLDSEIREIVVPDLTSTQTSLGTPVLFRGRTPRDIQQLKADAQAVPATGREFSRTDRVFMRVAAYGAGAPVLSVHMLSRAGQTMSELPVTPPADARRRVGRRRPARRPRPRRVHRRGQSDRRGRRGEGTGRVPRRQLRRGACGPCFSRLRPRRRLRLRRRRLRRAAAAPDAVVDRRHRDERARPGRRHAEGVRLRAARGRRGPDDRRTSASSRSTGTDACLRIYLDDYYVSAGNTGEVRDALHRFVDQDLGPGDLVTILRPLDSLLSIRLTRDRDVLHRAIDAFEGRRGDYVPRTAFERNYMVNDQAHAEVQRTQSTWSTLNALALHLANLGDGPEDDAARQRAGGSDAAPARPRSAADLIVGDADGEPRERGDLRPRPARRGRQGRGPGRRAEPAQRARRRYRRRPVRAVGWRVRSGPRRPGCGGWSPMRRRITC